MEWKPNNISKSELERKQQEYVKKALEMSKHSKSSHSAVKMEERPKVSNKLGSITNNLDKEIIFVDKKPEKEIKTILKEPVKIQLTEIEINKEIEIEAIINKRTTPVKEPLPEAKIKTEKTTDIKDNICDDITDNPFAKTPLCECDESVLDNKKAEPDCDEVIENKEKTVSGKSATPLNFNEFLKGHNEQFHKCNNCGKPKKK